MTRDLYGITEAELLVMRRAAQDDLVAGGQIVSSGTGDINSAQQIILHARQRIREINYELMCLGSVEAPADVVLPTTFVKVSFAQP